MKLYLVTTTLLLDDYSSKENLGIYSSKQKAIQRIKDCLSVVCNSCSYSNVQVDGLQVSYDAKSNFKDMMIRYKRYYDIEVFDLNGDRSLGGFSANLDVLNK